MLFRDCGVFVCLLLSAILSILTLSAGHKRGMLDTFAIVTYTYPLNTTVFSQGLPVTNPSADLGINPFLAAYNYDIASFVFSVHFLSLCAGYTSLSHESKSKPTHTFLECTPKPFGWTFWTDDHWIGDFGMANGLRPVSVEAKEKENAEYIDTSASAVLLAIGLVAMLFGAGMMVLELNVRVGLRRERRWCVEMSTLAIAVGAAALLVALLGMRREIVCGSEKFYALFGGAVAGAYAGLLGKAWNDAWREKERRRGSFRYRWSILDNLRLPELDIDCLA
ncbi:hypothetical protein BJ878DRAFT_478061 [Calycina marina]|uniref:Uncharacterized protein n=1 Tax=Calycina marina TaxID=1763456 RepID=A0A9P7Z6Z0_9HELO|nr:hypothetical protein BJ878DRAFT_478061 [Calycina marina]